MPRLSTTLLSQARKINPLLVQLLRTCRDLQSAQNELRWLRQYAIEQAERKPQGANKGWRTMLNQFCIDRSRGKPLQYILGSQPFGDLEILCRSGVLIPRAETETYTSHMAECILEERRKQGSKSNGPLRILDLGTGTGCIPLLLHACLFRSISDLQLVGIDIAPKAIALARKNLQWNVARHNLDISARRQISFQLGDIRETNILQHKVLGKDWDIVISNPPYISPEAFNTDTSRSVRNFEPGLALMPPSKYDTGSGGMIKHDYLNNEGDTLYPAILNIAKNANTKLVVLEVSDLSQAIRVASIALKLKHWDSVEVWRDSLNFDQSQAVDGEVLLNQLVVEGHEVLLRGTGNGRAVVCWKKPSKVE